MKWFKHDTDASTDARVKKLILKHGAEGYAIYFHCLELIAGDISETNVTFELEHDAEIIADNLKIKGDQNKSGIDRVNEIMKYIISLDLFTNDNGHIRCYKIAKRIDASMTSNSKLRELINQAKNHDEVMTKSCEIIEDHARLDKTRQEENINLTKSHSPIGAEKSLVKVEKPKKEQKRDCHELSVFQYIWQCTITINGIELIQSQKNREAKACWDLVDLCDKQFGDKAIDGVYSIVSSFMTKKRNDRSNSGYWRDKSPRPSTILSCWPQLLETLREQTLTKEQQEAIDEIKF